jgi:hypothetical protein
VLTLHLVNRLLAVLLSLAVVVTAAVLAAEVVRWALDSPPWVPWHGWAGEVADVRTGDRSVLIGSAVAVLAGLLLLLFELAPRRPETLRTAPLVDGVDTVTTRRGLRTATETAARGVSGVRSASADVGRRTVRVSARTRARGVGADVKDQVRNAVEQTLADLQLERSPKVRVSVEEDS